MPTGLIQKRFSSRYRPPTVLTLLECVYGSTPLSTVITRPDAGHLRLYVSLCLVPRRQTQIHYDSPVIRGPCKYCHMATFMIMGDSWARGEFNERDRHIQHPGTREHLRQAGHRVITVAEEGSSNRAQVTRLLADPRPWHHCVWFLTDPLRDLSGSEIPRDLDSYRLARRDLLRRQFDRVRHLEIWVVGGVCAVPEWMCGEYPGLRCVVPDLRRWLMPQAPAVETLCRAWPYPTCEPALLAHWESEERRVAQHRAHALIPGRPEHQWFWPDGTHPNRGAHLRLTQELILPMVSDGKPPPDQTK
jgi:hypothetical protein